MKTLRGILGMWGILGWVVFIGLAGNFALKHGQWWEFGAYGAPRTLVAVDGVHHPNGEEIDPVTLGMARSGLEEEAMLVVVCILALVMAYLVWLHYQSYRHDKQHAAYMEELTKEQR